MGRRLLQATAPQRVWQIARQHLLLRRGWRPVAIMEDMKKQLLSRREFNGLCAALGSSLPTVGTTIAALSSASAFAAAPGASSNSERHTVKFRDGTIVPALGLGSAGL